MKRFIIPLLACFCAVFAFTSCHPDEEFEGTVYGFWVAENLTVETQTTINGTTTTNSSTTNYGNDYCRLYLDSSNLASLWYNLDLDIETFTYDEARSRILFKESLNAGDNGKAIVLLGAYEVELVGDSMVLRQPEFAIGTGSDSPLFEVKERATYTFHRAPKSEKPKETTN